MGKTIQTIGLIGAGAVGSYVIWGTEGASGIDFRLIAEGRRAERLRNPGLVINGKTYTPPVCTPEEYRAAAGSGPDLLLIAVKGSALPDALDLIRRAAGSSTIVMSLLNGIDSEEIIGSVIDPSLLVYSLIRIASRRIGASVVFDPDATLGIYYGEPGHREKTERVRMIEECFSRTRLRGHFMEDIVTDMWVKFCSNIENNLPQAILGVGYGACMDSVHVDWLRRTLEQEVIRVAASCGIHLEPQGILQGYRKSARFSTLQDLDAGRTTEVDMFLGTLMDKAKAAGIEVPAAACTWHLIKALEEKNSGLFAYSESE